MTDQRPADAMGPDSLLREVANGVAKIRDNAADLQREAELLRSAGALSRALFLHQISMEECAKVEMLAAWCVSRLAGQDSDQRLFSRALASHKAKNNANAYFLPPSEAERNARQSKDWNAAAEAFEQQRASFHQESNLAKNAALYVDVSEEAFSAPADQITDAMVADFSSRNAQLLAQASSSVRVLSRWATDSVAFAEIARWSVQRLETLMAEFSGDPTLAIQQLLTEGRSKLLGLAANQVQDDA